MTTKVACKKADTATAELEFELASIEMSLGPGAECIYNDVYGAADAVCTKADSAVKALHNHLALAEKSLREEV